MRKKAEATGEVPQSSHVLNGGGVSRVLSSPVKGAGSIFALKGQEGRGRPSPLLKGGGSSPVKGAGFIFALNGQEGRGGGPHLY